MSDLLEVRVIGAPEAALWAVDRLGELLEVDRVAGPYPSRPSRRTPKRVRYYLSGHLRPAATAAPIDQGERAWRHLGVRRGR